MGEKHYFCEQKANSMNNQQQLLPIGSVIGHYRVVRHIASGGFGNTYEVEHVSLPLRRCIKEFFMRGVNQRVGENVTVSVEDNRATFEQMRMKFLKEAQRMAQFHNAHVVPVTDFFEQNGTVYYVMELIEGQSLSEIMKAQGRPFTEAEVREMLPQVLDALRGVHDKGIYHLDLKPANIMRDGEGHLWLIDFGASKQLTPGESLTLSTSTGLCYTPGYAPSELVQGATKYIGPWTDFYSLGATLYNLLTQQKPPEIADIEEEGEKAFAFPANVSAPMRRFVVWLMNVRRSERPQTVKEVEERLAATLEPLPEVSVLEPLPEVSVETTDNEVEEDDSVSAEGEPTLKSDEGLATVKSDEGQPTVKRSEEQVTEEFEEVDLQQEQPKSRFPVGAIHVIAIILLLILFVFVWLSNKGDDEFANSVEKEVVEEAVVNDYVCPDSNHPHTIDLGLPSGTLWACCNLGAGEPNEYGDYYAWGETGLKSVYSFDTYQHGSSNNIVDIGSDIAGTIYDAATANRGAPWQMPSEAQCKELINNCTSEWTTQNGVNGRRFIGPNGNSIFLPAAGFCWSSGLGCASLSGYYWSSTIGKSDPRDAYDLYFYSGDVYWSSSYRYDGLSVRPVRK